MTAASSLHEGDRIRVQGLKGYEFVVDHVAGEYVHCSLVTGETERGPIAKGFRSFHVQMVERIP